MHRRPRQTATAGGESHDAAHSDSCLAVALGTRVGLPTQGDQAEIGVVGTVSAVPASATGGTRISADTAEQLFRIMPGGHREDIGRGSPADVDRARSLNVGRTPGEETRGVGAREAQLRAGADRDLRELEDAVRNRRRGRRRARRESTRAFGDDLESVEHLVVGVEDQRRRLDGYDQRSETPRATRLRANEGAAAPARARVVVVE